MAPKTPGKIISIITGLLALSSCKSGAQDSSLQEMLVQQDLSPLKLIYNEVLPMEKSLRFSYEGASEKALLVHETLKANCPQHWDKSCWLSEEKTIAVSHHDALQLLEMLVAAEPLAQTKPTPLPPGSSTVSLQITAIPLPPMNLTKSYQVFLEHPKLKRIREQIMSIAQPILLPAGDTPYGDRIHEDQPG